MEHVSLTNRQARKFMLLKQGLIGDYKFHNENGICDYIKQAGCIQFDPIDVCGRNADLVLQSRVAGYTKDMLYKLLYLDRKLIDYFDKNMSIIKLDDWKFFSRQRLGYMESSRSKDVVNGIVENIRTVVKEKGFVCSRDLSFNEQVDWTWNATTLSRAALETLYFRGELILHHKKGNSKYYTFAKEHISNDILAEEDPNLTLEDHWKWRIIRRIGAVGLLWNKSSDAWLGIDGLKTAPRNKIFGELIKDGTLVKISIENIEDTFYCLSDDKYLIYSVLSNLEFAKRTEFIAPLDNLLWDRSLINRIFNFKYKWEIYTPMNRREYGYYVLPVLFGDRFIGRIELVNDRKRRVLVVKNFWREDGILEFNTIKDEINACIDRFKTFNSCDRVEFYCTI